MDKSAVPVGQMTLGGLVTALDHPLVELLVAPQGTEIGVRTHALAEADDLGLPLSIQERAADIVLLVGARGNAAIVQLPRFDGAAVKALLVKLEEAPLELMEACVARGIALVSVNPQARWEHVHGIVGQLLRDGADRSLRAVGGEKTFGTQNDLFGLALSLASLTGGMVTIDDAQSRLLAFSPLDDSADELRRMSILGRGAAPGHFEVLAKEGVFDRLRRGELLDMIPTGGSRRRLAIGIHSGPGSSGEYLGTVWVQEGRQPLNQDAKDILNAATRFVARLIGRTRLIPSSEEASLQRLLTDSDSDLESTRMIYEELGLDPGKCCIVVGFDVVGAHENWLQSSHAAGLLALQATALKDTARVTSIGRHLCTVFVDAGSQDAIVRWARNAVHSVGHHLRLPVRAAVAAPVFGLTGAWTGREEVERILDASSGTEGEVLTLKETITQVLLRSVAVVLHSPDAPSDPRLATLLEYDRKHDGDLIRSVFTYLVSFGNIREASNALHVHPNTMRYRLRRASEVSGLDLADADTRCLLHLQLRTLDTPM